ncbi:lipoate-protein ligase A [Nocardioides luteus]|uniref:Lipoate--protein ligase A n=1 Tax=Nocardioides luteus TaxID=1844 RepID=A0ABQ5T428_9ACTN|nr:biotin/lipoate A/B protein ligase family protein [Nocardioides luteus]MDR7311580.1 lipoate-protein ligase A [Nocardioides luteus]GGR54632.1 lipoate--protein ligase A [Nocardioides luteus]GLJ70229.1 lipoate--protein ligase A [Nocardioides luteus]
MSERVHGERKVRGGKLVVVDATVSADTIEDVVLSGDFFLEPDEALEWLRAALEGQSVDASLERLTADLDAASRGADLVGFTTRDIALTVLRALGRAATWDDLDLEIVETGPLAPTMQMALDEVIVRQVAEGRRAPNLRFWHWASSAVVIGSYQSLANEVDEEAAERHGIEVVRRISGGGAMFVEPGNTITYSLAVPDTLVAGMSFQESYAFLDEWVLRGLQSVGIEAAYAGLNDIASPVGKIAGAAQKRIPGGVLHHVTMAYDIDADKMLEVLRIGREKMSDKGTKSAAKRVDPIRSQTGLSRDKVIAALLDEFERSFGAAYVGLDQATIDEAAALVESKHGTREWISRVP